MDKIIIEDLEVFYRVGVPDTERAKPQRLLVTVEMALDLSESIATDRLEATVDYAAISRDLADFGSGRTWKLIERLAAQVAEHILARYKPKSVRVTVKKFAVPRARHVAVSIDRARRDPEVLGRVKPATR